LPHSFRIVKELVSVIGCSTRKNIQEYGIVMVIVTG
jgi:hypothetical protein